MSAVAKRNTDDVRELLADNAALVEFIEEQIDRLDSLDERDLSMEQLDRVRLHIGEMQRAIENHGERGQALLRELDALRREHRRTRG